MGDVPGPRVGPARRAQRTRRVQGPVAGHLPLHHDDLHRSAEMSMRSRQEARGKRQACGRSGFTLIEVMISIFLVLLLIVGINQAFKVVSSTVGAGQAMSSKSRDSYTAHTAYVQEIGRALVHDDSAPFLIIGSRMQPA